MEHGERITISQLVSLKARREQSVRSALSTLARQEHALLTELDSLAREQDALRQTWGDRCNISAVLDRNALSAIKSELSDYYLTEQRLIERLHVLKHQLDELRVEKCRQAKLLKKAVTAQEKFTLLLESPCVFQER